MLLTLNLASKVLASWLIAERTRISLIVPRISQILRRYQGNLVMACEKLYILIVKRMKI